MFSLSASSSFLRLSENIAKLSVAYWFKWITNHPANQLPGMLENDQLQLASIWGIKIIRYKNEDKLKNQHDCKNKDNLKNEDKFTSENNLENENSLKNEDNHIYMEKTSKLKMM